MGLFRPIGGVGRLAQLFGVFLKLLDVSSYAVGLWEELREIFEEIRLILEQNSHFVKHLPLD